MARRVPHDDTGALMRRPLVVIVWLLATAGVVYVANTAVELVDLQVFPEGASIRVLERASAPTTTVPVATTTVPVATTTVPAPQLVVVDSGTVEVRSGSSYQVRLASGGSPPYEWSVVSGSLPAGLELSPNGFIEGIVGGSGRFVASVQVTDSAGRTGIVAAAFVVREYRFIRARGGSATVVVTGDSVGFFSALHGEGFKSTQVLRSGPLVVEVAFLPISGDEISWVRCEVVDGVSCTQD